MFSFTLFVVLSQCKNYVHQAYRLMKSAIAKCDGVAGGQEPFARELLVLCAEAAFKVRKWDFICHNQLLNKFGTSITN